MTTAVSLSANPILQFFNNQGQPNAGGYVLTQVGGTNYATYQDSAGTIPLPNPIPLNSRGEVSNAAGVSCQLFLVTGATYTFILYDAIGNQINQATYVSGPGNNVATALTSLAASTGSSLIGFIQAGIGAVLRTIQDKLRDSVNVADFGGVGDGATDDTAKFNAAALYLATIGGGILYAKSGAAHYIAGTVLIPSNVTLDLNGGTLKGTGNGSGGNTLIASATYSGGVLSLSTLSVSTVGMQIRNGTLFNAGLGMSLVFCIDACRFSNLQIDNCYAAIYAQFCEYADFSDIMARNTSAGIAYRFSNNCNSLKLTNVHACGSNPTVWGTGFQFDTKTYGVVMLDCSSEFCTVGIVTQEVHGFTVLGHYFESCSIGVNLNASLYRKVGVNIDGCFFSNVANLVYGRTVNNFRWGTANERSSNCSPGTIDMQTDTSINTYSLSVCTGIVELNDSLTFLTTSPVVPVVPAWMFLSDGIELKAIATLGKNGGFSSSIYAKANIRSGANGGIVPFEYVGYTDQLTGQVPFCAVSIPVANPVTATITTGIGYSIAAFTIFQFVVVDSGGTWTWQGRAYGTNIYLDFSSTGGRIISIANTGGYLVVSITNIQNAGGAATITGQIRHI